MSDSQTTIAAIVPMRHFSRRVSGKNYRMLAGRPLYRHVLDALLAVPAIDEVVVDTDSETIIEEIRNELPQVRIVLRPEHLRSEMLTMNDILLNTVTQVQADCYLQTHSTNPLLQAQTIAAAIDALLDAGSAHDSLFSVTPRQTRFWSATGTPVNHDPENLIRTQDLPPIMEENSCLYIFRGDVLRTRRNRIGARPLLFEMDPMEALDIDTEFDWRIVEAVMSAKAGARG